MIVNPRDVRALTKGINKLAHVLIKDMALYGRTMESWQENAKKLYQILEHVHNPQSTVDRGLRT